MHCRQCGQFLAEFTPEDARILAAAVKTAFPSYDLKGQQAIKRALLNLNGVLGEQRASTVVLDPCPDCGGACVDTGGTSCGGR